MNKGITVNELKDFCLEQIKLGNGNKHIQISDDDEGNGFHTLIYAFTTKKEELDYFKNEYLFHDNVNTDEIVVLG